VLLSSARRSNELGILQQAVESAVEQLSDEIANLRSLITELRPASLDELGLGAALDALLERTRAANGLEISAKIDLSNEDGRSPKRLDAEIETAVYRIVQESLTNAARHAEPQLIEVEVAQVEHELRLVISDDGKGFDPDIPGSGFGLTGMRERVSLVGGTLEVVSSSAGTTISVVVPTATAARQIA
jgi:signal transduction histidine kinase